MSSRSIIQPSTRLRIPETRHVAADGRRGDADLASRARAEIHAKAQYTIFRVSRLLLLADFTAALASREVLT